jgi:Rrf2 family protein
MATNARLAAAIHTLGLLAFADGEPVTSERIAGSVSTNPVTIRRIFQALGRAGLVIGQMGPNGGARLARAPEAIRLDEVWRALGDGELFAFPPSGGNPHCPVSCAVKPVLGEIFAAAESALERSLAEVTLADVIARVQARSGGACGMGEATAAREAGTAGTTATSVPIGTS